ncbi:MAG: DNA gyrase inhibitor YacG [Pseudomonadota bacterium]
MQDSTEHKQVKCPTCNKPARFNKGNRWRPFCSERCKLIDLGAWFDESNRIPGESNQDENQPE